MCGRTRCSLRAEDVGVAAGHRNPLRIVDGDRYRPSYNVAPGKYMPVVRQVQGGAAAAAGEQMSSSAPAAGAVGEHVVHCMKWGLIPSYTKANEKPDHFRMFNARSESVHLKSTFSRLLKKNRCVTAVEGFYEWKKDGSKRQPYYLHLKEERPLVFAALYDSWKDEEGNVLHTFTILTTRNSKAIGWLHDRMPVILPDEAAINLWLGGNDVDESTLHKLTLPYEGSNLVWYPVTPEMGKPSFDVHECVQEIKPKTARESSIFQLFGKSKNAGGKKSDNNASESQASDTSELQQCDDERADNEAIKDEDWDAEDKKALLAGMEPDKDATDTFHKGDVMTTEQNMNKNCDADSKSEVPNRSFIVRSPNLMPKKEPTEVLTSPKIPVEGNGVQVKKESFDEDGVNQKGFSSPAKKSLENEPDTKRQRVSVSPQASKKSGGKGPVNSSYPGKQRPLEAFFGKK